MEAANYSLGSHPYKKLTTPNTGAIVSAQGFKDGIEKIIMPKIRAVTGSHDIKKIKNNSQGVPVVIEWSNGSVTYLMSAEQENKVFEGITVDWAWIDEPVRREIFIALNRGMLTTGGHTWLTCTPLDEPWIYEDLYMKGIEGDPNIAVFEGSSDENSRISEEDKKFFKSQLTQDEIDARWHGKFRHLSGRVFKSYHPDRHLIPSFDIPAHWPVWISIDPHRNKPHAVLFLAISPQGIKYVCNEIHYKCPIVDLAGYVLDLASQYNVLNILIDTSAQEEGWGRMSAREILQRNGVRTKLAQKRNLKASGIILINQSFDEDSLFVMNHCKRMHKELTNQIYKKNKQDRSQILEEPEKKWDDQTDNLRYVLVERPAYSGLPRIKEVGPIYARG